MTKKFSETESKITQLFSKGTIFTYNAQKYEVLLAGKPSPAKGECKTDTYVLAKNAMGVSEEFKISIKQKNADFLENKINLERAQSIFGSDAQTIIGQSIDQIKDAFLNDYLVLFEKYKRTEAKTIKIGWKFELMNKMSGEKSGEILLTPEQILDVYAGANLSADKRNSSVNGELIDNSGVANYMLVVDRNESYTLDKMMDLLMPMEDYIKDKKIYFACKAINYRASRDKWDGNRPLAVFVDWKYDNGKITANIVFDQPLATKANSVGEQIRILLQKVGVNSTNFSDLEEELSGVKYLNEKK